jgi:hypothetical protein
VIRLEDPDTCEINPKDLMSYKQYIGEVHEQHRCAIFTPEAKGEETTEWHLRAKLFTFYRHCEKYSPADLHVYGERQTVAPVQPFPPH